MSGDCIDENEIECPKAREYLRKHGKLCNTDSDKPRKPRKEAKKGHGYATRIWEALTT